MKDPSKVAQTPLAQGIYARMIQAGHSQKSLADKAKLNQTYVRDIFNGNSKSPEAAKLQQIADVLQCGVEELSSLPESPSQPKVYREVLHDREEIALVRLFRPMSVEMKAAIFTLMGANADAIKAAGDSTEVGKLDDIIPGHKLPLR